MEKKMNGKTIYSGYYGDVDREIFERLLRGENFKDVYGIDLDTDTSDLKALHPNRLERILYKIHDFLYGSPRESFKKYLEKQKVQY